MRIAKHVQPLAVFKTNVDVRFEAFEAEGRFFINPGSATGAWSGLWNGSVEMCPLSNLRTTPKAPHVFNYEDAVVKTAE